MVNIGDHIGLDLQAHTFGVRVSRSKK